MAPACLRYRRSRSGRALVWCVRGVVHAFVLCLLTWPGVARSQAAQKNELPVAPTPPLVLPELPEVPSSSFGKPSATAKEELEEHLKRVRSADAVVRERAIREVLEAKQDWVPAIYHRVNQLADDADADAMKETLRKIRNQGRDAAREDMQREGEKGKLETPDYLAMVAEYSAPDDESWQALISVLAMSRMLVAVGNVEAARVLIQIYVRFGEFLRVDTQKQLAELGDRAAPALIEARKHPAAKIGQWAERQLDQMGKAIASELVQTTDQQALADILRAYGRIQDPDAARIIVSFANSERAQVRLAARQSVRLLGEVGNWQLRETYQDIVGKTPPRDWPWKRTAQELFYQFDRLRLAQVHEYFEAGMAAQKKGDYDAARQAFDKVLAHNPMFDRRDEMVDGYVAYASQADEKHLTQALLALRRAERINGEPKRQAKLESLRLTLEAEALLGQNLADQSLFRKALELDPENQRARQGIAMIERGERIRRPEYSRYYGAGAIGIVGIAGILLILLWRPKTVNEPAPVNELAPVIAPNPEPVPESVPDAVPAPGPDPVPEPVNEPAPAPVPTPEVKPVAEATRVSEPAVEPTSTAPNTARGEDDAESTA